MAKSRNRKLADLIVTAGVDIAGNVTFDGGSTSADLTFADGDKANFGASSDLQVYHDGSNSYIKESGSGALVLQSAGPAIVLEKTDGENMLLANVDGAITLYYNGSEKLATTSTGINVTGITTSDTLVLEGTGVNTTYFTGGDASVSGRQLTLSSEAAGGQNNATHRLTVPSGYGSFNVTVNSKERVKINNNGDVSFYNDASSNAVKMFWDASAESLGIGTTSPGEKLEVNGNMFINVSSGNPNLTIKTAGAGNNPLLRLQAASTYWDIESVFSNTNDELFFKYGTSTKMAIDKLGNVGIGTVSPNAPLSFGVTSVNSQVALIRDNSTSRTGFGITNNYGVRVFGPSDASATGNVFEVGQMLASNGTTYQNTRFAVQYNGNVGIGTASPVAPLDVQSNSSAEGIRVRGRSSDSIGQITLTNNGGTARSQLQWNDSFFNIKALAAIPMIFYTTGTERMRIQASGNVGIGTTAPSTKLEVSSGGADITTIKASYNSTNYLEFAHNRINAVSSGGNDSILFQTAGTARAIINQSGNVGIGTDSPGAIRLNVTTPTANHVAAQIENSNTADSFGLIVKAGNDANDYIADFRKRDNTNIMRIRGDGKVGIGTASPSTKLNVKHTGSTAVRIETDGDTDSNFLHFKTSSSTGQGYIGTEGSTAGANFTGTTAYAFVAGSVSSGVDTQFLTAGAVRATIDHTGNVGIGTSSPGADLHVAGNGRFDNSAGTPVRLHINNSGSNDYASIYADTASAYKDLVLNPSGGNLLVGTTVTDTAAVGFRYRSSLDAISSVADGGISAYFGRRSSDGDIVALRKDDAIIGSIGTYSSTMQVGQGNVYLKFANATDTITPANGNGTDNDAALSLGSSGARFKDLYLSGHANFNTAYASTGIYLGAYATPNLLDDYEEGTWTPTIAGYGQNTPHSQTYSVQTGNYTKVGNLVTAHFFVTLSNKGNIASASGNYAFIMGLPFTHAGSVAGIGVMWGWQALNTAVSMVAADISSTNTQAWLTHLPATSGAGTSYMGTSQITNTTSFRGTLIYKAS